MQLHKRTVKVVEREKKGAEGGNGALALPAGATASEARAALAEAQDEVLAVRGIDAAFCTFDSDEEAREFDSLVARAFHADWCCSDEGPLKFDFPPPVRAAQCSHLKPGEPVEQPTPQVDKAVELQDKCDQNQECRTECKNHFGGCRGFWRDVQEGKLRMPQHGGVDEVPESH